MTALSQCGTPCRCGGAVRRKARKHLAFQSGEIISLKGVCMFYWLSMKGGVRRPHQQQRFMTTKQHEAVHLSRCQAFNIPGKPGDKSSPLCLFPRPLCSLLLSRWHSAGAYSAGARRAWTSVLNLHVCCLVLPIEQFVHHWYILVSVFKNGALVS